MFKRSYCYGLVFEKQVTVCDSFSIFSLEKGTEFFCKQIDSARVAFVYNCILNG